MRSEAVGVMIARGDLAVEVMLNMGPHIQQAVTVLDSILRRMQAHQSKKTSMLASCTLGINHRGRKSDFAAPIGDFAVGCGLDSASCTNQKKDAPRPVNC